LARNVTPRSRCHLRQKGEGELKAGTETREWQEVGLRTFHGMTAAGVGSEVDAFDPVLDG
jgi:hypothetical protein